jgi:hypothetical protein
VSPRTESAKHIGQRSQGSETQRDVTRGLRALKRSPGLRKTGGAQGVAMSGVDAGQRANNFSEILASCLNPRRLDAHLI